MRGLVILLLVACKGTTVPTGEETDGPTDQPTVVPTPVELECDDQTDDDGDGAIDCEDTDCQAMEFCSWPQGSIRFDVDFRYTASFEATLADYNSCQILGTVDLVRDRTRECPSCDRVFCGDFVFSQDNCNPEITRPMAGCFGLTFTTDTSWDVDVYDEAMTTWSDFGSFAEGTTAGTLELTLQDDIVVDVPPFGPVDGGSFVVDFSLTPL